MVICALQLPAGGGRRVCSSSLRPDQSDEQGNRFIYFEDISAMDYELFESRAKEMSEDVIESQLLDQIHRVSKIASVKMRRVRWAFLLSAPASALWLVLLAWGTMG